MRFILIPQKTTLNINIASGFSPDASLMSIARPAPAASYDVEVSNILGSELKKTTINQQSWQTDVSSLTPGTYVITVINAKDKSVIGQVKFVKL